MPTGMKERVSSIPAHALPSDGMLRVAATNQPGWRLRIAAAARFATLPVSNRPRTRRAGPRHPRKARICSSSSAAFAAPIDGSIEAAASSRSFRVASSQSRSVWKSTRRGGAAGCRSRAAERGEHGWRRDADAGIDQHQPERRETRDRRQVLARAARDQRFCGEAHRQVRAERQRRCASARSSPSVQLPEFRQTLARSQRRRWSRRRCRMRSAGSSPAGSRRAQLGLEGEAARSASRALRTRLVPSVGTCSAQKDRTTENSSRSAASIEMRSPNRVNTARLSMR